MPSTTSTSGRNWTLIAAFAIVYIIWGSTYLAIGYAVETLPPFLMAGVRFLVAGSILFGLAKARGTPAPTRAHWRSSIVIGALLFLVGNGGVTWAEKTVPSGLASLVVAIVPVWVVLLEWVRPGGRRPTVPVMLGVVVGLVGMALLVSGGSSEGANQQFSLAGLLALLAATFCWSLGSLYALKAPLPSSPMLTNGMEMLCGGVWMLLFGTLVGEWRDFDPARVTLVSVFAVLYLIVFGAMIAFSAYNYVLNHTTPARASTYAYVNPVVAVFLGWLIRGEPLTPRTVLAAAVIVSAVVIITTYRTKQPALQPVETALPAVEGQKA